MCGIYGMVALAGDGMVAEHGALQHPEVLDFMGEALRHRGPDGHADFREPHAVIGTERLRIIDLHERADQPFASPSGEGWLERQRQLLKRAGLPARHPDQPLPTPTDRGSHLRLCLEPRAGPIRKTQRRSEDAVEKQVMSDGPVGVFISGGMDSSILAALASRFIGVDKVHPFSAKFAEESYDESGDAAELARQMRTTFVPVR